MHINSKVHRETSDCHATIVKHNSSKYSWRTTVQQVSWNRVLRTLGTASSWDTCWKQVSIPLTNSMHISSYYDCSFCPVKPEAKNQKPSQKPKKKYPSVLFSQTMPHLGWVLTVGVKAWCSFEMVSYVCAVFADLWRTKVPLWDVHVHFDCAGSHKPGVAETFLPKVSFY